MDRGNKVVLLGDSGVGKTALAVRWTLDQFVDVQQPTIGASYSTRTVEYEGKSHKIQVWDTAGQERYRSMAPIYCQNAMCALLVFDVTDRATFDNLAEWRNMVVQEQVPMIIVGNKIDLESARVVQSEEAVLAARELNCAFFEVSAVTGFAVGDAFTDAVITGLVKRSEHKGDVGNSLEIRGGKRNTGGCC